MPANPVRSARSRSRLAGFAPRLGSQDAKYLVVIPDSLRKFEAMPANNASQSFSFFGFLVREGTALIFAGLIWYAIWGGYQPRFDTSDHAFKEALVLGLFALGYLGLQALAVVSAPLARETRYLLDLLLSLVPLALIGYATAQALSGQMPLSLYQWGVLWLGGTACVIDVVLYTWFNMKLNKLASDYVPMR
jgi:hypothetical protein